MAEAKREDDNAVPISSSQPERDTETPQNGRGDAGPGDSPADPPVTGEAAPPAEELKKLQAEKADLLQTLIRRQADFENFRKRTERDRYEEGRRGVERLITDLIPVLDAFDRALKGHEDPAYEEYRKGVTLIRKQLWDTIARHGVERIEASGKMFDPHLHQAVERVETQDAEDGSIVEVFQDGYLFHGRVLRPAIVRVAVHPGGSEDLATFEN